MERTCLDETDTQTQMQMPMQTLSAPLPKRRRTAQQQHSIASLPNNRNLSQPTIDANYNYTCENNNNTNKQKSPILQLISGTTQSAVFDVFTFNSFLFLICFSICSLVEDVPIYLPSCGLHANGTSSRSGLPPGSTSSGIGEPCTDEENLTKCFHLNRISYIQSATSCCEFLRKEYDVI